MLFDTLTNITAGVTSIDFSQNTLDDDCMVSLGRYIQSSPNFYYISLSDDGNEGPKSIIGDKGIETLSESLYGNNTFRILHLNKLKRITSKSATYLIDMAKNSGIFAVELDGTLLSHHERTRIAQLINIPITDRNIPILSKTKSAAKSKNF